MNDINMVTSVCFKTSCDKFGNLEHGIMSRDPVLLNELKNLLGDILSAYNLSFEEILQRFELKFEKIKEEGASIQEGYIPWIDDVLEKTDWINWEKYKESLINKGWSNMVIESIDFETNKILDRTFNPLREDKNLYKKGLVIGRVQSGKTANYMGVIAKGFDLGFKIIIILTGVHEDLRKQTFTRIQEEIGNEGILFHTSEEKDFVSNQSFSINDLDNSNDKHLFIIKKNTSVMKNLIKFLVKNKKTEKYISKTIIIDDEADNASINTKSTENPTITNNSIRKLIQLFSAKAYIGYTATPYANVFIEKEVNHSILKDDIFPSDFILTLPISEFYCGPEIYFPRNIEKSGLFADYDKDTNETIYNGVLRFILTVAIRTSRGSIKSHNTMLIHDSLKIVDHVSLKDYVENLIERFKGMQYLTSSTLAMKLKSLFEDEYVETSLKYNKKDDWENVMIHIPYVLETIEIAMINSIGDKLVYEDDNPKVYIAIGGNKLSRGLTLEGLSISIFSRNSKQYDTLMQMGRWFGYKHGYIDLCRIIMNNTIYNKFVEINNADRELFDDLRLMNSQEGMTPRDFALKVRATYQMLPTSKNKMGKSYGFAGLSGKTRETLRFGQNSNIDLTEKFILELGGLDQFAMTPNKDGYVKLNVGSEEVLNYLQKFQFHMEESNFKLDLIQKYIEQFHKAKKFNVVLVNQKGATKEINFAGKTFLPVQRTVWKKWRTNRLLAPSIEIMDLDVINKGNSTYDNEKSIVDDKSDNSIGFKNFKMKYRKDLTLYIILAELRFEKLEKTIDKLENTKLIAGLGISFPEISTTISNYYYNF